jgi:hypothetical protein
VNASYQDGKHSTIVDFVTLAVSQRLARMILFTPYIWRAGNYHKIIIFFFLYSEHLSTKDLHIAYIHVDSFLE